MTAPRRKLLASQIDAIAERVYLAQERAFRKRYASPPIKPWTDLSPAEKWPWRDGVRIYLGEAMRLGWQAPAQRKRPGSVRSGPPR
jgi:hypothetical protein